MRKLEEVLQRTEAKNVAMRIKAQQREWIQNGIKAFEAKPSDADFRQVSMMRDLMCGMDFLLALTPVEETDSQQTNADVAVEAVQQMMMIMVALFKRSEGRSEVVHDFVSRVVKLESINRLAPFDIMKFLGEVLDDLVETPTGQRAIKQYEDFAKGE